MGLSRIAREWARPGEGGVGASGSGGAGCEGTPPQPRIEFRTGEDKPQWAKGARQDGSPPTLKHRRFRDGASATFEPRAEGSKHPVPGRSCAEV